MSPASTAKIIPLPLAKARKRRRTKSILEKFLPLRRDDETLGLEVRESKGSVRFYWRAPREARKAGFEPELVRLHGPKGHHGPIAQKDIVARCRDLNTQAYRWLNPEGASDDVRFTGTISALIRLYLKEPHSPFHGNRSASQENRRQYLQMLEKAHGNVQLENIRKRELFDWHKEFSKPSKRTKGKPRLSQAKQIMISLSEIARFGTGEYPECDRIHTALSSMTFPDGVKMREEIITAEQAAAIRKEANRRGRPSVAIVQALEYEGALRQKDCLGEWAKNKLGEVNVPSAVTTRKTAWAWGLDWSQHVSKDLILKKPLSKANGNKCAEIDLKLCPMVIAELNRVYPGCILETVDRVASKKTGAEVLKMTLRHDMLPSGPAIIDEKTNRPWMPSTFRRVWREIARAVGVPDNVQNRDSRAGAVSEGENAGIPLETLRHLPKHSAKEMTERYSRSSLEHTRKISSARASSRVSKE